MGCALRLCLDHTIALPGAPSGSLYPARMDEKRTAGDTGPSPASQGGARPVKQSDEDQRFGPLLLSRYVKDDGRALILFAHAAEEQA